MKTGKATLFIVYSLIGVSLVGTAFSHLWRTWKKRDIVSNLTAPSQPESLTDARIQ